MAFILEEVVGEIQTKYATITGDAALPVKLGNLEKALKHDVPSVVWTLIGGNFKPSTEIGGVEAAHTQANATFAVWFWFEDLEKTWNAMVNMLAAIRATAYGPNADFQNLQCPSEVDGHVLDRGEAFILSVGLSVPMFLHGTQQQTEVTLEAHEASVTTQPAIGDPPTELVIVTGP